MAINQLASAAQDTIPPAQFNRDDHFLPTVLAIFPVLGRPILEKFFQEIPRTEDSIPLDEIERITI